jgi:hypothetical protein
VRRLSDYLLFLEELRESKNFNQNLILRHDIDVGLSAGLAMVQAENSIGIESITFVRMDSECFNPFGIESADQILSIARLGTIGLHMNSPSSYPSPEEFNSQLLKFKLGLESIAEVEVKEVSWHRPDKRDLGGPDFINGLRNFYSDHLFVNSVYVSDSANSWSGEKQKRVIDGLANNELVHLLIHPEWWLSENHSYSFEKALSLELKKAESEINREISFFGGQFRVQNLDLDFVGGD